MTRPHFGIVNATFCNVKASSPDPESECLYGIMELTPKAPISVQDMLYYLPAATRYSLFPFSAAAKKEMLHSFPKEEEEEGSGATSPFCCRQGDAQDLRRLQGTREYHHQSRPRSIRPLTIVASRFIRQFGHKISAKKKEVNSFISLKASRP